MGKFSDHLRKNIERVLVETNYKLTHVAYFLFTRAVIRSPHVGQISSSGQGFYITGHFINNWFPAINGYDSSASEARSPDGADSLARINSVVKNSKAFYKRDGFITLSNNLNYAARVEFASVGWPKGYDPASGWNWTGKAKVYAPVQYAMQDVKEIL